MYKEYSSVQECVCMYVCMYANLKYEIVKLTAGDILRGV